MPAGDYNARIELERDTLSRVNAAEVRTASVYAQCYAHFAYLSGTELWRAQQINATVRIRVRVRYRTDVLASDRVVYRGKRYEIVSVLPDDVTRETVLEVKG